MLQRAVLPNDFAQLITLFHGVADIFSNDWLPHPVKNRAIWQTYILELITEAGDWFYVRKKNHEVTGAIWANNWIYYHNNPYACEVSAFSQRGMSVQENFRNLQEFTQLLFQHSRVYIIRAVIDSKNIPARRALKRAGFSHPETQRAAYLKNNVEHTTIIYSMTRPEFENQLKKRF